MTTYPAVLRFAVGAEHKWLLVHAANACGLDWVWRTPRGAVPWLEVRVPTEQDALAFGLATGEALQPQGPQAARAIRVRE